MEKLSIANEMAQFDRKNRKFYDELTPEERKKFSTFLMLRWGSSVQGSGDLQEFYLIATNERLNKHFFSLSRHPKLQWLMATTVSPGLGLQRHQWIAPKKKEAGAGANQKLLAQLFPNAKASDIEVLDAVNTQKEITAYLRELGQDAKK